MDTYYTINRTYDENEDKPYTVTMKKGDNTKTYSEKFKTEFEAYSYINDSRFYEVFQALDGLGWTCSANGVDIFTEFISPMSTIINDFTDINFDYSKIESVQKLKSQMKQTYDKFNVYEFTLSNLPDFDLTADVLKDFVEDGKAIKDIYLSAYKELDKIVDCLQNDKQYIFKPHKQQSSSRLNLNNKIADWLVEHQSVLDDLSSYCDMEKEELISSLNTKQSPNIIFNNGTPFKVIMRDNESHVALLKNEVSNYYNVACDINDETGEWSNSLVYSQRLEVAKQIYANKTAEKMDYEKYRTIHYLEENHPYLMYDNIQQIVDHAKVIRMSVDDDAGERTTLEDLSKFIAELYEYEDYQSKNIDYLESPIYSLSDNDILDKFYANDYDIEDFLEDDGLEI